VGDTKYTKLAGAASRIKSGRLGAAWRECDRRKDEEGRAGEEAKALLGNLEGYAARMFRRAEEAKGSSPAEAVETLRKLKAQFAGAPQADEAAKRLDELDGDKAFQAELKAQRDYEGIEETLAKAKVPERPAKPADAKHWDRRYGSVVRRVKSRVDRMKRSYPDARFTKEAEALLARLAPGAPEE